MALSKERLANAITSAFIYEQAEEEDAEASARRIADKIAEAVLTEIKKVDIIYTHGLTSPDGAVTGQLNYVIG